MKIKTTELTGRALDWAIARCVGRGYPYPASTDWSIGGPIIEREGLTLTHQGERWAAQTDADEFQYGPTPLVAAMRCFVASKLGDEVDVPEELS
jgi:hypothetical protein